MAKVQDRAYGRQNELIYGLLDFTGVLRVHLGFYGSFWVLFLLCLLPPATLFLCLYARPTYSIVLTIVHSDGTSILSLHNISL